MENNKQNMSENKSWTTTPGWSGYVAEKEHGVENGTKPSVDKKDGSWTCTPGWCGYVKHDEK